MHSSALPSPARIDEFLPAYDLSASYGIRVNASCPVVYQSLLRTDFSEHWIVRALMTLRSGKRLSRNPDPGDLRQRLQGTGFVMLAEIPDEEVVIGVAGKFWRFDGGRCFDLTAGNFVDFSRAGYAKAAMNFTLQPESPQSTWLSTETRIQCLGSAARWKFRLYWTLVGVFSGVMRKVILRQVKTQAEAMQISG